MCPSCLVRGVSAEAATPPPGVATLLTGLMVRSRSFQALDPSRPRSAAYSPALTANPTSGVLSPKDGQCSGT
jgi:hypothetical protein